MSQDSQNNKTIPILSIPDEQLYLEDWKMTKDRIKHFDDIVIRLRLQAFPISAALISLAYLVNLIPILYFAAFYLIPILLLDIVHFILLLMAVNHAMEIEELPQFKEKLKVTHSLTSGWLSLLHILCYVLYVIVWVIIGYLIKNFPILIIS